MAEREPVRIVAEVAAAEPGFEDALRAYVQEALDGLGVPGEAAVSVVADAPEPAVQVEGSRCRAVTPMSAPADQTPESLAAALAQAVIENRDRLITPAIRDLVVRRWEDAGAAARGLDGDGLGALVLELARNCVRVVPGEPAGGEPDAVPAPEEAFEAIVAARGASAVGIAVAKDLEARIGPEPGPPPSGHSADISLQLLHLSLGNVMFEELGVWPPAPSFEVDPDLPDGSFRLRVNDLLFPPHRGLLPTESMVAADPAAVDALWIKGRPAAHPTQGSPTTVIAADADSLARLHAEGYRTWGQEGYLSYTAARELRRYAGALLFAPLVRFQLGRLHDVFPVLTDAALARFGLHRIVALLRRLLSEHVSIRDLAGVLEGALAAGGGVDAERCGHRLATPTAATLWPIPGTGATEPGVDELAGCVRRHLRDQVTTAYSRRGGSLDAVTPDRALEARLREVPAVPVDDPEREALAAAVRGAFGPAPMGRGGKVVLASVDARRPLRELLEPEFPLLPVVSPEELAPGTHVQFVRPAEPPGATEGGSDAGNDR